MPKTSPPYKLSQHTPIAFNPAPQAAGGLAVYNKYGREHMRRLGRRGYRAMVERHFDGDQAAANKWLAAKGQYSGDETYRRWGLSKFADPGPHPAHQTQEAGR